MTVSGEDAPRADTELYELLNEGLALYHAKHPFEAHEVWEFAWASEVGKNKLTLQAIILIAAAFYKYDTGNARGTSKLLAKAREKIADIRVGCSAWLGIDLVRLEFDLQRALQEADAVCRGEGASVELVHLPRVTGRDGILFLHGAASSPTSTNAGPLLPELRALGYHVDVPTLGEGGDGPFGPSTLSAALRLARRYLRDRSLVIGCSLGGHLGALLAKSDQRVKGLVRMEPEVPGLVDSAGRALAEAKAVLQTLAFEPNPLPVDPDRALARARNRNLNL